MAGKWVTETVKGFIICLEASYYAILVLKTSWPNFFGGDVAVDGWVLFGLFSHLPSFLEGFIIKDTTV